MNHDCHLLNEDLKWNKGIKNTYKYLLAPIRNFVEQTKKNYANRPYNNSLCSNSYQITQEMLLKNFHQMQNEASYKHDIS